MFINTPSDSKALARKHSSSVRDRALIEIEQAKINYISLRASARLFIIYLNDVIKQFRNRLIIGLGLVSTFFGSFGLKRLWGLWHRVYCAKSSEGFWVPPSYPLSCYIPKDPMFSSVMDIFSDYCTPILNTFFAIFFAYKAYTVSSFNLKIHSTIPEEKFNELHSIASKTSQTITKDNSLRDALVILQKVPSITLKIKEDRRAVLAFFLFANRFNFSKAFNELRICPNIADFLGCKDIPVAIQLGFFKKPNLSISNDSAQSTVNILRKRN